MVQLGFVKPNNDVIQGIPPHTELLNIETVANCYPGSFVKRGTTDNQIVVCGAAEKGIGWIGYGNTPSVFKPATRDTIQVDSDTVAVESGGGFRVRAILAAGQTCIKGTKLKAAAAGQVTEYTIADDEAIAEMDESLTSTGAAQAAWVKSLV